MLTQTDSDKINAFYYALERECNKYGVPVMLGGNREEGDERNGVWLVSFIFQIGLERFELYVNLNITDEDKRYGYRRV